MSPSFLLAYFALDWDLWVRGGGGELCLGVKRGFIGGGWRLFVEFDSYAIAPSSLMALCGFRVAVGCGKMLGVTRWGLFSRRGVLTSFFFKICRSYPWVLSCTLSLGAGIPGMGSCWVKPARSIGRHVHVMITNHRVKH